MSDDNVLFWSCKNETFIKISSEGHHFERLGYKFDTEWHLEIRQEGFTDTNIECPFVGNDEDFARGICPVWKLFLNRNHKKRKIKVTANFYTGSIVMYRTYFTLETNLMSKLFATLELRRLRSPCFNLALTLKNDEESVSAEQKSEFLKLNNLSEDFQSMLNEGNYSDVTIKCDSEDIRVHRSVMGARSPVFEAMFRVNMLENKTNEVIIEDMKPSVFRAMVGFIYSGQMKDLNFKFASDLLQASEKYQISGLKEGCVEYLSSILSHENVFEMLEMADLYDESLKLNSIQYICRHFSEFKNKEEWQIIKKEKPILAVQIYSRLEPYIEKST